MANTIGKDKRTTASARSSTAARVKSARTTVPQRAATKAPVPVEEPVQQDVALAEPDESVETDDALDLVPADDVSTDLDDANGSSELMVTRPGTVARRQPAAAQRGGVLGFIIRLLLVIPGARYVASSVQELRKVTAPTPREAWNMTLVVIAMSAAVAIILGAADLALIRALGWIVSLGTSTPTGTH